MKENTARKEDERLVALLGVAASKPQQTEEPCPPPEILSAFIENRLPAPQRSALLAHFNRCEDCYREWIDAALHLEASAPAPPPARDPWWRRIREAWGRRWLVPLATATAMGFLAVAVLLQKPTTDAWEAEPLVAVVTAHPELRSVGTPPLAPRPALAFSDTTPDPALGAFSAGFDEALRRLGRAETRKTAAGAPLPRWEEYYRMGQWTLLTWILSQGRDVQAAEWEVFNRRCLELIARLDAREQDPSATRALASLRKLQRLLRDLARNPDPATQARLARLLRQTLHQWLV